MPKYLDFNGLEQFKNNIENKFMDANEVKNLIVSTAPESISEAEIGRLTATPQNYTIIFESGSTSRERYVGLRNCVFDNFTFDREISHSSDILGNYAEVILLDEDNNEITVQLEGYATNTAGTSRYSPANSSFQNSGSVYSQNIANILNNSSYCMGYGFNSDPGSVKTFVIIKFITPILRLKINSLSFKIGGGSNDYANANVKLLSSNNQIQFEYNRLGNYNITLKVFEDIEY